MRSAPLTALGVLLAALGCRGADVRSPDPAVRVAAVRAAAGRGGDGTPTLLLAQRDADARVRRAAAEAFASREGPAAVDALATFLSDPDPEVVGTAARSLAARPSVPRTRDLLVASYAGASPAGRAAVADALQSVGTSLRDAVELEARVLWERNLAALAVKGPAQAGAAEEIGASARAEAVAKLLPLVDPAQDPDHALAAGAARGLGEAGDGTARHRLESLLEEGDAELAEVAAEALGLLGDPGAADALEAVAAQGAGRTAEAAVGALSALPQAPEVAASLCEVALRSLVPAVASQAARAARERDADCPVKILLARLGKPGEAAALAALSELRGPDAEVAPKVIPLIDPAKQPDAEIRLAALRVLGTLKSSAAAAAVRERLMAQAARVASLRTRWIRGSLPAEPLAGMEGGGEKRLQAVLARPVSPALRVALAEPALAPVVPVPRAELSQLGALLAEAGHLRVAGAEGLLLPYASDPDPAVQAGALYGLGALGGEAALGQATAALSSASPELFQAASGALRRMGVRGVSVLVKALEVPALEPWRCVALASDLGEAGLPEAVPSLGARLGGPCGAAAAQALGKLGAPSAVALLAAALDRPDSTGRLELVEALAQIGGGSAASALARELTSDRPQVRAAAARALAVIRYEPASGRLEALRSDYYGQVRRAAVEALAKLPTGDSRPRP